MSAPRFCAHCDAALSASALSASALFVDAKGRVVGYCGPGCRAAMHATATTPATRASRGRVLPRPGVRP